MYLLQRIQKIPNQPLPQRKRNQLREDTVQGSDGKRNSLLAVGLCARGAQDGGTQWVMDIGLGCEVGGKKDRAEAGRQEGSGWVWPDSSSREAKGWPYQC